MSHSFILFGNFFLQMFPLLSRNMKQKKTESQGFCMCQINVIPKNSVNNCKFYVNCKATILFKIRISQFDSEKQRRRTKDYFRCNKILNRIGDEMRHLCKQNKYLWKYNEIEWNSIELKMLIHILIFLESTTTTFAPHYFCFCIIFFVFWNSISFSL